MPELLRGRMVFPVATEICGSSGMKWQPGILCNFQGSTVGPKHKRVFVLILFEDLFDCYRLASAASPVLMKMM